MIKFKGLIVKRWIALKTIVVIGGGITGLSAMYELQKWKQESKAEIRLILIEANKELGGKIRTITTDEFVMEAGADSIVSRKTAGLSFINELGLENQVVYNATGKSFIYIDGELKQIPTDTVFGIPTSIESLAKSTLVSAEGKVAALQDFYRTDNHFTKNDSVGEFLEYYFGKELVERQISPVLSGVYSGDLKDLTLKSTLPYLLDFKDEYGSIIKGFEANKEKFRSGQNRKFFSFKNGLKTLIDTYEAHLKDVDVLKGTSVEKLSRIDEIYQIYLDNGEMIECNHCILAIPNTAAEKILNEPELSDIFSNLKNSSLISVYLGYDISDTILPIDGTGFISAAKNELSCNACTWTSRKWNHTSKKGNLLIRLFYKSSHPTFAKMEDVEDDVILKTAMEDIKKSMGITEFPLVKEITFWSHSMPNYLISHPNTVDVIEKKLLSSYPGILIAGCSYYGVGIPDCIENGRNVAQRMMKLTLT
jgi:protoporphyrinogen/coproporphyrinogen III oxidase